LDYWVVYLSPDKTNLIIESYLGENYSYYLINGPKSYPKYDRLEKLLKKQLISPFEGNAHNLIAYLYGSKNSRNTAYHDQINFKLKS
jgi:hypothetical protein